MKDNETGWSKKLRNGKSYAEFREELIPDIDITILLKRVEKRHNSIHARCDILTGQVEVKLVGDNEEQTDSGEVATEVQVQASKRELDSTQSSNRQIKRQRTQNGQSQGRRPEGADLSSSIELAQQSRQNRQRARKRQSQNNSEDQVMRAQLFPQKVEVQEQCGDFQTSSLRSKADGYTALNKASETHLQYGPANKAWTVDGLQEIGFRLVPNDGSCSIPILDVGRQVVAAVVSHPADPAYAGACTNFHNMILKAGVGLQANTKHGDGWAALASGLSHGLGQPHPKRTKNTSEKKRKIMDDLLGTDEAKRISGFQSAAFARWCPSSHDLYKTAKKFVQEHKKTKDQRWNFSNSVFASATVNFGPQTWTHRHRDVQNLPHGWCAITALGLFDYRKGGHLILWDLKLVVEFPAGCTVLLPSATIAHSNIPIAPGETRTSYTQYSAGPIFRWVDYGGRNLDELTMEDPVHYRETRAALQRKAGLAGSKRFTTLEELISRRLVFECEDVS